MKIGNVYILDKSEQQIVELVANQRQNNKVNTGWDGKGTVNKKSGVDLKRKTQQPLAATW